MPRPKDGSKVKTAQPLADRRNTQSATTPTKDNSMSKPVAFFIPFGKPLNFKTTLSPSNPAPAAPKSVATDKKMEWYTFQSPKKGFYQNAPKSTNENIVPTILPTMTNGY